MWGRSAGGGACRCRSMRQLQRGSERISGFLGGILLTPNPGIIRFAKRKKDFAAAGRPPVRLERVGAWRDGPKRLAAATAYLGRRAASAATEIGSMEARERRGSCPDDQQHRAASAAHGRRDGPPSSRSVSRAGPRARWPGRPVPPKLYRIGEIVDYTGVSRQTIHNYTTMGLITESRRTAGGHRLYDESVFVRLGLIAELRGENRSLREIRRHFATLDLSEADVGGPKRSH